MIGPNLIYSLKLLAKHTLPPIPLQTPLSPGLWQLWMVPLIIPLHCEYPSGEGLNKQSFHRMLVRTERWNQGDVFFHLPSCLLWEGPQEVSPDRQWSCAITSYLGVEDSPLGHLTKLDRRQHVRIFLLPIPCPIDHSLPKCPVTITEWMLTFLIPWHWCPGLPGDEAAISF